METIRTLWDLFGVWIFLALIIAFIVWAVRNNDFAPIEGTLSKETSEYAKGFFQRNDSSLDYDCSLEVLRKKT